MKTVIIGRFQPLHNGHVALFEKAFSFPDEVVVVLGSARQARTPKNPFTAAEREAQIRAAFPGRKLSFVHMRDYHDDALWNDAVRRAVGGEARLISFEKDDSSYYLRNFPEWERAPVTAQGDLSATEVRNLLFSASPAKWMLIETRVPAVIADYLKAWAASPQFPRLQAEFEYYAEYKEEWGAGTHVTADAVMVNDGKVLLVRRATRPGAGLLALPGGFVEPQERLLDCAIREMREETGLNFTGAYLKAFLTAERVRDFPARSLRGRVISHVFCFRLDTRDAPPVTGGDDAKEALWVPIGELPGLEESFFEDHFLVLADLLPELAPCQAAAGPDT
jgi:bifunctional NMN adenylyltransferase/nudix hydrolase